MKLYRCNKADDPRCPRCPHGVAHERHSKLFGDVREHCTNWSPCFDAHGKELPFKVRCVSLKGES